MNLNLKIKPFVIGEDYPELCEWWREYGWKAPLTAKLSTVGVVAFDDKRKLAAGWLYVQNSGWGFVDYFVGNPVAPMRARSEGLKLVIEHLSDVAKSEKIEDLVTFTKNKGLIRLLGRMGFTVGDESLTSLLRRIQ